jgi:hypothetical protein
MIHHIDITTLKKCNVKGNWNINLQFKEVRIIDAIHKKQKMSYIPNAS